MDDDDDDNPDTSYVPPARRSTSSRAPAPSQSASAPAPVIQPNVSRVVDDEDAELQAALKASLEGLPEGFVVPPTPPRPAVRSTSSSYPPMTPMNQPAGSPNIVTEDEDEEDSEDDEEAEGKGKERELSPEQEKLDVDEMRRRRLARFGA